MNLTATIEYLYRDGSITKLNTSNKKELKQFFEKTCCGRVGFVLHLAGNSNFWRWLGQL